MKKRPLTIYILILLWLTLSIMFILWGVFSLSIVLVIPEWVSLTTLQPQLYFGYLISTIIWFVFSSMFLIFAYGTFRGDSWTWSTGLIFSTIFLAVFSLMLAAFIVTAITFLDWFSVSGLITAVISLLTDLGIVYFLTRPIDKEYFEVTE
ncbi:MAG: hypothetical protein KAW45_00830 [Thermoplasmatales archaeon]|nr:hypothetical protein [Thermoplasmatales archaeon]